VAKAKASTPRTLRERSPAVRLVEECVRHSKEEFGENRQDIKDWWMEGKERNTRCRQKLTILNHTMYQHQWIR
jgi:hypothetical protein